MPAPTLQAQGNIAAVTTGNLAITLPTYTTNDIVVITTVGWVPNTTTGTNTQSLASPWTKYSPNITTITGGIIDAEYAFWWARATSGSSLGTTVTITRPTSWDTGADTCWAGRAYVIRGCGTTGNPYDELTASSIIATANPQIPASTVLAAERNVIAFYCSADNNTAPTAATGYTVGTADTTNTGTDAGFQTYSDVTNTSVSATTPTGGAAPAQGGQVYFVASFKKPLVTVSRTASNTGTGTESATGVRKVSRTASNTVTGTESATGVVRKLYQRTASTTGTGTQTAVGARVKRIDNVYGAGQSDSIDYFLLNNSNIQNDRYGTGGTIGGLQLVAQSFTGNGKTLDSISVLSKVSTAITDAVAYIFAHTGTYGTNGTGTGSPLATSEIRSLGTSINWNTFQFTGSNKIVLNNGTYYVLAIGSTTSTSFFGYYPVSSLLNASGNRSIRNSSGSWGVSLPFANDLEFKVFSTSATRLVTSKRTASNTGTGTQSATRVVTLGRTASGFGGGDSSSTQLKTIRRSGAASGTGTQSVIFSISFVRTATGSGTGTQTVIGARKLQVTASGAGTGTQSADGSKVAKRTASASGTGTQTATKTVTKFRTASASGTGTQTNTQLRGQFRNGLDIAFGTQSATGLHTAPRTATGAGTGTSFADGVGKLARTATGSGIGYGIADDQLIHQRSATGSGTGTQSVSSFATFARTVSSSGTGSSSNSIRRGLYRNAQGAGGATTGDSAVAKLTAKRTATGSGAGDGSGDDQLIHQRSATGSGTGTSSTVAAKVLFRTATGSGTGTSSDEFRVIGGGLVQRTATGNGTGSATSSGRHIHKRSAFPSTGFGTQTATRLITRKRTASASGQGTQTVVRVLKAKRLALAVGTGTQSATRIIDHKRTVANTGYGLSNAVGARNVSVTVYATGVGTSQDSNVTLSTTHGIGAAYWGIETLITA